MGMSVSSEDRLTRVANAAGLERRRNGLWSRHGTKGDWRLDRFTQGWLALRRQVPVQAGSDPLALHADWAGPVKLVARDGGVEQRVELFLGNVMTCANDPALDAEAAQAMDQLTGDLLNRFSTLEGQTRIDGWTPPAAERLTSWLQLAGCETAIDKDHHVRFTLKRRGCDGQVRIERADGRLRFGLPLGRWKQLSDESVRAMKFQAGRLNAHSRLVRIAWITESEATRCEAQVDLSGVPVEREASPHLETVWREMTRLAVAGLELALRQLGLELPVLADMGQVDVMTAICQCD